MTGRRYTTLVAIGAAIVALLAGVGPARAAKTPIARRSAVGADLSWWSARRTGSVFPMVPFFHYPIVGDVFVDVELGAALQTSEDPPASFTDTTTETHTRFGFGNPMVGAHWAPLMAGERLTPFLGLQVGIPIATTGSIDADRAIEIASAASGYWDVPRWVVEYAPFVATFGLEAQPTRGLWLRVPVAATVYAPMYDRRDVKVGLAAKLEIEGVSRRGFGGGMALQLVATDAFRSREPEDHLQAAIEPYIVFDDDRLIVRLGLINAVDAPLGPWFQEGGVATLHLTLGAHLP